MLQYKGYLDLLKIPTKPRSRSGNIKILLIYMKNNMKKIIIGILSLAMLFAGQSASASVTWNNNSQGQDCPTINIATPNQGGTNGGNCWTGVDVSASAGEKV